MSFSLNIRSNTTAEGVTTATTSIRGSETALNSLTQFLGNSMGLQSTALTQMQTAAGEVRIPVGSASTSSSSGSNPSSSSTPSYESMSGDLEEMFGAIQAMHAQQQHWAFTSKMESLRHQTIMSMINNA